MSSNCTTDPLSAILPDHDDRAAWVRSGQTQACDTRDVVFEYQHRVSGRRLRLDARGRVYGQDAQGVVRLFGRGGALALTVALNAAFDGMDRDRPVNVVLPR